MTGPFKIGSRKWPGTGKAQEETGELNQLFGKIVNTDEANKLKLIEEIGDVYAALDYFVRANKIDLKSVQKRRRFKRNRYWLQHKYARKKKK